MSRHPAPVQVHGAHGSGRAIPDQTEHVPAGEVPVEAGARRHMRILNPQIRSVTSGRRPDLWTPPAPPRTGAPGPGGEPVVDHSADSRCAGSDDSAEGPETFASL